MDGLFIFNVIFLLESVTGVVNWVIDLLILDDLSENVLSSIYRCEKKMYSCLLLLLLILVFQSQN